MASQETKSAIDSRYGIYQALPPLCTDAPSPSVKALSQSDSSAEQASPSDLFETTTQRYRALKSDGTSSQPFISMPPSPPQTPTSEKEILTSPLAPLRTHHTITNPNPSFSYASISSLTPRKRKRRIVVGVRGPGGEWNLAPLEQVHLHESQPTKPTPSGKQPEYEIHVGDPCTLDGLDHILGCSHRVITALPEPCGANCRIRDLPDYAQPRDTETSFLCMQCIAKQLQVRHEIRCAEHRAALLDSAAERNKEPNRTDEAWTQDGWIEARMALMEMGWNDLDLQEIKKLSTKGKPCDPFLFDLIPDRYKDLVSWTLKARRELARQSRRSSIDTLQFFNLVAAQSTNMDAPIVASSDAMSLSVIPSDRSMSGLSTHQSNGSQHWRQSVQSFFKTKEPPSTLSRKWRNDRRKSSLGRPSSPSPSSLSIRSDVRFNHDHNP